MGWLETTISGVDTPWANRIRISVDGSKIEGNLYNFPVLIKVGSDSGKTNRNTSEVSSHLTLTPAYRYWRLYQNSCTRSCSSGYEWHWGYMGFYESTDGTGANLATVGNTSISSRRAGNTNWPVGTGLFVFAGYNAGEWVVMDYGSDVRVRSATYRNLQGSGWAPTSVKIQYSNDGINWADAVTYSDTGAVGTNQTFEVPEITIYTKSIAITASDGVTQQYTEIEDWDVTTSGILLWTKVPTLSSGISSDLYLYYDNTMPENTSYVGETGTVPAMNVWDSDFKLVCHLTSAIEDSTNNNNDGVNSAANDTTGLIGDAKSFPDTADKITFPTNNYGSSNTYTVEMIVYPTSETGVHLWEGDNALGAPSMEGTSVTLNYWTNNATSISTGNLGTTSYRYLATRYDKAQTAKALLVDTTIVGTESTNVSDTFGSYFYLGNRGKSGGFGADARNYGGTVDEFRISTTARSTAWLKATYYSNFDDLLTYYAPIESPTFKFEGYVQVLGEGASREVGLYRRSNMVLVDSTTSSSGTGYFELYSPHTDYHFVVILPELDDGYNLLSYDKIHPEN